jgi:hypothetical protein
MTARTTPNRSASRIGRVTPEFSRLDQAAAIAQIRRLADSGLNEREIVARTGWSKIDVRRALAGRL